MCDEIWSSGGFLTEQSVEQLVREIAFFQDHEIPQLECPIAWIFRKLALHGFVADCKSYARVLCFLPYNICVRYVDYSTWGPYRDIFGTRGKALLYFRSNGEPVYRPLQHTFHVGVPVIDMLFHMYESIVVNKEAAIEPERIYELMRCCYQSGWPSIERIPRLLEYASYDNDSFCEIYRFWLCYLCEKNLLCEGTDLYILKFFEPDAFLLNTLRIGMFCKSKRTDEARKTCLVWLICKYFELYPLTPKYLGRVQSIVQLYADPLALNINAIFLCLPLVVFLDKRRAIQNIACLIIASEYYKRITIKHLMPSGYVCLNIDALVKKIIECRKITKKDVELYLEQAAELEVHLPTMAIIGIHHLYNFDMFSDIEITEFSEWAEPLRMYNLNRQCLQQCLQVLPASLLSAALDATNSNITKSVIKQTYDSGVDLIEPLWLNYGAYLSEPGQDYINYMLQRMSSLARDLPRILKAPRKRLSDFISGRVSRASNAW